MRHFIIINPQYYNATLYNIIMRPTFHHYPQNIIMVISSLTLSFLINNKILSLTFLILLIALLPYCLIALLPYCLNSQISTGKQLVLKLTNLLIFGEISVMLLLSTIKHSTSRKSYISFENVAILQRSI